MNNKDNKLKIYFCPKCKSKEVGYIFTLRNIFGIIPKMKCRKCQHEGIFPIIEIDLNKLKKFEKKQACQKQRKKQMKKLNF